MDKYIFFWWSNGCQVSMHITLFTEGVGSIICFSSSAAKTFKYLVQLTCGAQCKFVGVIALKMCVEASLVCQAFILILTAIGTCHWNFPIALDIINDAFPTSVYSEFWTIQPSLINCTGVVGLNIAYIFPIDASRRMAIFLGYTRLTYRIQARGRCIECAQMMDCTCSVTSTSIICNFITYAHARAVNRRLFPAR